jgi:two-component system, cell cycle response regulator DivK
MARILMIDDDRAFIELVDHALIARGCVMTYADNGADGVRLAKLLQPDLVLLDIRMPGMDGFEVAAELRRHPELANAQIVGVTSDASDSDRERMLASGFDGTFLKPFDVSSLVDEIEPFLPEPLPAPAQRAG